MSKKPLTSNCNNLERFCQTKEDLNLENCLEAVPSEEELELGCAELPSVGQCDDPKCKCKAGGVGRRIECCENGNYVQIPCGKVTKTKTSKGKKEQRGTNTQALQQDPCISTQTAQFRRGKYTKVSSEQQCEQKQSKQDFATSNNVSATSSKLDCSRSRSKLKGNRSAVASTISIVPSSASCAAVDSSNYPSAVGSEAEFSCLASSNESCASVIERPLPRATTCGTIVAPPSNVVVTSCQTSRTRQIVSCTTQPPKSVKTQRPPRNATPLEAPNALLTAIPLGGPPPPPPICQQEDNMMMVPYVPLNVQVEVPYLQISEFPSTIPSEESTAADESDEAESTPPRKPLKKVSVKSKSDTEIIPRSFYDEEAEPRMSLSLVHVERVQSNVNLSQLKADSRVYLARALSGTLKPGISGLKEYISERSITRRGDRVRRVHRATPEELKDFVDYFIDCDGLRYIGLLEQIQLDFEERVKAFLLTARPNQGKNATTLRHKLAEIAEVQPVYQEKILLEFDFPAELEKEIKWLEIDYGPKTKALRQLHDYGNNMAKYWFSELDQRKVVHPSEIHNVGTQMMAELIGQVFSLLVKCCQFIMCISQETKKYRRKYTVEGLINVFCVFRSLVVQEVGAIGETCGQVMVRIPNLPQDEVVRVMSNLYHQVNFADICISRAFLAAIPLILFYDFSLKQV